MQKEIFYEEMKLLKVPGWQVLEEDGVIAFKSPVSAPLINFAYGVPSVESLEKVRNFYKDISFTWMVPSLQDCSFFMDKGFGPVDLTFEMIVDLAQYVHCKAPEYIQIKEVQSDQDFQLWISIASQCFGVSKDLFNQFFSVWRATDRYVFFIGYVDGIPAATSLVGFSSCGAALHCIGTLPQCRRRGLGSHVIRACLQAAKLRGLTKAVLYASDVGKSTYEKLGFQLVQTWNGFPYEHEA
jgi:GNAT superfamily N-acetyltransferase